MADVTPRINGADRPHFANQTVRFIGRLEGCSGRQATLLAPDNHRVTVHMLPQSLLQQPTVYEVIGRVQEDGSITEMTSIVLGDQFDIALYNDLLTLIPKVPEMFV